MQIYALLCTHSRRIPTGNVSTNGQSNFKIIIMKNVIHIIIVVVVLFAHTIQCSLYTVYLIIPVRVCVVQNQYSYLKMY